MKYSNCVKDGKTLWNERTSIYIDKCISSGNVKRNELSVRPDTEQICERVRENNNEFAYKMRDLDPAWRWRWTAANRKYAKAAFTLRSNTHRSTVWRDLIVRVPVWCARTRARAHASSRRDSTYSNLFTVLEDDSVTGNDLDLLHHLLLYTIVRLCTATRSYFRISSGRLTFLRACWLLIKYFFRLLDGKHEKTFVTQFVLVISGCLKFKGEQVECAREQHFARTSIGTLDSVWCDTVSRRFSRYNGKSQASFTNVFHFVIPFTNGWLLACSSDANV